MHRKIRGKRIVVVISVMLLGYFIFEGFKIHNKMNLHVNKSDDYIDGFGQSVVTVQVLDDKFVSLTKRFVKLVVLNF